MAYFLNADEADDVTGTAAADEFRIKPGTTGAGADRFAGGGGNDSLDGGDGPDSLFGEAGSDWLRGGGGDDLLDGGADDDTLQGEDGSDIIHGGDGNDNISAGSGTGRDTVWGGAGNDQIHLGGGASRAWGADGDDVIYGSTRGDRLFGGAGNDVITAGEYSADTRAADLIEGGAGNDTISAAGGNDTLRGGRGNDWLYLGSGGETASFDVDLAAADHVVDAGSYGRMMIDGFENIRTVSGSDTIRGTDGRNRIETGGGDDLAFGRAGADRIEDGTGDDTIYGGRGNDEIRHTWTGIAPDRDLFFGGAGRDRFVFSDVTKSAFGDPDTIGDFARGQDAVDLSGLRGPGTLIVTPGGTFINPGPLLDLTFIGRDPFSGGGRAELRVARDRFEVDWNGDGAGDMAVALTGAGFLDRGDFVLG